MAPKQSSHLTKLDALNLRQQLQSVIDTAHAEEDARRLIARKTITSTGETFNTSKAAGRANVERTTRAAENARTRAEWNVWEAYEGLEDYAALMADHHTDEGGEKGEKKRKRVSFEETVEERGVEGDIKRVKIVDGKDTRGMKKKKKVVPVDVMSAGFGVTRAYDFTQEDVVASASPQESAEKSVLDRFVGAGRLFGSHSSTPPIVKGKEDDPTEETKLAERVSGNT